MTTASSTSPITFASGTFAPVMSAAMGTPRPSVRMCRLTPLFARSVGLGPVRSPLLAPSPRRCRASSTSAPRRADRGSSRRVRDESRRTRRAPPTSENAGGRSSLNRSRSATPSTDSPSSAGTGCPPSPPGRERRVGRLAASLAPAVSAARSDATKRRERRQTWLPRTTVDHTRSDLSRGFRIDSKASRRATSSSSGSPFTFEGSS